MIKERILPKICVVCLCAIIGLYFVDSTNAQSITPISEQEKGLIQVDTNAFEVPESLRELGVTIQLDKPEGAILTFSLPDVYILPDSRLYWFVKVWESLQLVWAETPEEKSDLLFHFAEMRLSETVQLLQKNDTDTAVANLERYRGQLSQAIGSLQEIQDETVRDQRYNRLDEQVWYQRVLSRIIQAEGISDVMKDMSSVLGDRQIEKGGVTLEDSNQ